MAMYIDNLRKQFDKFEAYINRNISKVDFGEYDPFEEGKVLEKEVEAAVELEQLVKDLRDLASRLSGAFKEDQLRRQDEVFNDLRKDPEQLSRLIQLMRSQEKEAEEVVEVSSESEEVNSPPYPF